MLLPSLLILLFLIPLSSSTYDGSETNDNIGYSFYSLSCTYSSEKSYYNCNVTSNTSTTPGINASVGNGLYDVGINNITGVPLGSGNDRQFTDECGDASSDSSPIDCNSTPFFEFDVQDVDRDTTYSNSETSNNTVTGVTTNEVTTTNVSQSVSWDGKICSITYSQNYKDATDTKSFSNV